MKNLLRKILSKFNPEIRYYHFPKGRMLSFSKSTYDRTYPEHFVIFNAKIYNLIGKLIWSGDLDLSKDFQDLLRMNITHKVMYITYEMGRKNTYVMLLFFGFIKISKVYEKYITVVRKYKLEELDKNLAGDRFQNYLNENYGKKLKIKKNVQTSRKQGNRRSKTVSSQKIKKQSNKK